jgi:hypothetical protein
MKLAAEKIRNILDVEAKPVPPPQQEIQPVQPVATTVEEKVQDEFISDLELALRELEQF